MGEERPQMRSVSSGGGAADERARIFVKGRNES